jgi:putative transposase
MRRVLTDPIWKVLGPRVDAAKKSPMGAKPELPDREFLEAVLYRARTGLPWRDLPAAFGDWNAVYQRFKRWKRAGVFDRLFAALPAGSPLQKARLFIDSTTVRAHPHAAGAKKKATRRRSRSAGPAAGSRPRST